MNLELTFKMQRCILDAQVHVSATASKLNNAYLQLAEIPPGLDETKSGGLNLGTGATDSDVSGLLTMQDPRTLGPTISPQPQTASKQMSSAATKEDLL
jgi:hypothetical protein